MLQIQMISKNKKGGGEKEKGEHVLPSQVDPLVGGGGGVI